MKVSFNLRNSIEEGDVLEEVNRINFTFYIRLEEVVIFTDDVRVIVYMKYTYMDI